MDAKLYLTFFASAVQCGASLLAIPDEIVGHAVIDIGREARVSAQSPIDTRIVRVLADVDCCIQIMLDGSDESAPPTVSESGPIALRGGTPELFGLRRPGRIAVIARGAP